MATLTRHFSRFINAGLKSIRNDYRFSYKQILFPSLILSCLAFSTFSFADGANNDSDSVAGIYTGNLIINGVPNITITYNLGKDGTLIETSEGMVNNPAQRETTGSGMWRNGKKGSIDLVEVLYMNGGSFCPILGLNNCTVIFGINGKIDKNGLLTGTATNITIKSVLPDPPVSLNINPFLSVTIRAQKQSFDSLLFPSP